MKARQKSTLATRDLVHLSEIGDQGSLVKIVVYRPKLVNRDWDVDYEIIGLPKIGPLFQHRAIQVDSVGAVAQAIELIAVKLLSTAAYKADRLYWLAPGDKCGLTMPILATYC